MLSEFVAAAGGSAIVIGGLWWFVGRGLLEELKLANAEYIEEVRAQHSQELQALTLQHETQLESLRHEMALLRGRTERIDSSRLEVYSELWAALFDLRRVADAPWAEANWNNVVSFGQQLVKTEIMIGRRRLLLDTRDAAIIDDLISAMTEYHVGKRRLIDMRNDNEPIAPFEIGQVVEGNRRWRTRYTEVLGSVEEAFRKQISPA